MKKRKLLPLLITAVFLSLSGCKPSSSSSQTEDSKSQTSIDSTTSIVSSEQSEPIVSSEEDSEIISSTSEVSVPPTTDSSSEDISSSSETPIEPDPQEDVKATVVVTRGEEGTPLTSGSETSGAYRLTVNVENLPTGVAIADLEFEWPKTSTFADFHVLAESTANNVYEMTLLNAGPLKIEVIVKHLGTTIAIATTNFLIMQDLTEYTEISTPGEFIALITKGGTITEKYILGANLDLDGYKHDGKVVNATFNGVLDGNGYTVSNFTIETSEGVDGGLFYNMPSALVRNIHLIGNVKATGGWSGLLTKEIGHQALVINSIFEATDLTPIAGVDWTWQRNGVIAGMLRGTIENVVSVKISDNDRMLATIPYSQGDRSADIALATLKNVYTNIAIENLVVPFGPDPAWSSPAQVSDLHLGLGDFSMTKATDFDLDPSIFVLEDGKMPVLMHHSDEPAALEPKVELTVSKDALKLDSDDSALVEASLVNSEEVPVWGYTLTPTEIVEVEQDGASFVVTPIARGNVILKVTAALGEKTYERSVNFVVRDASAGDVEIPEDAFVISDAQSFKQFFDGAATHNNKNAILVDDIDLAGYKFNMGMAGSYNGIFEGQGYFIKNYSCGQALFNIMNPTSEVRNLRLSLNGTGRGFGPVVYRNSGTLKNIRVELTIAAETSTYAGVALTGTGAFIDCHVDWIFEGTGVDSKTLYPIVQADGAKDITNCTYSITGGNVSQFVTTNSNITLI